MLLLLDNYDSFTYNLKDYFEQLGQQCLVVRNNEITVDELARLPFTRIVLSPGPQRPEHAGILNEVIHRFHISHPILGICLGHQAIGQYFGAHLIKAAVPMHGKISAVQHTGDELFKDIPAFFDVCRYHSLVLQKTTPELKVIATTATGEIMGLRHATLPLWGVQFHPEAVLTTFGMQLLKNWLGFKSPLKSQ